jgi:regulatory protein YycH of two-component signal transduction system YycFG
MRSLFHWGIQEVRKKYEFCSFRLGEPPARRDLAVTNTLENNRSVKMMEKINRVVNWQNIEALLLEYYEQGKSTQGADVYPPLTLLKCLLLQKCL